MSAHHETLTEELLTMLRVDQDARHRWNQPDVDIIAVDARHTRRMHEIVDAVGWPGSSLVGPAAAKAAWLLVQHADRDFPFQLRCLDLMRAAPPGEVEARDLAFLTDRVQVAKGLPQVYGTQFRPDGSGVYAPFPIEDEAGVDARRAGVGLNTIAERTVEMNRP